jgi:hypothetical protein
MQVCPDDDEKGLRIGVLQEKNGKTIAVIGRFNESDVHISGRGENLVKRRSKVLVRKKLETSLIISKRPVD